MELPQEMMYIWEMFIDLNTKTVLTFTEIKNWSDLRKNKLDQFELNVILKLNSIRSEILG